MEYRIGRIGRIVVARGFEGEDLHQELESLARREKIVSATVMVIGGLRKGSLVVGPTEPTGPIEPQWVSFDDARELLAVGTLFPDEQDQPTLHLHAAIGRGENPLVGCPRGQATVFCVAEAVLLEIRGVRARRELDPATGLRLLRFGDESH